MSTQRTKAAVRARDGHACTQCGMSQVEHLARYGSALEVHRVTPGSDYAVDERCVTLCKSCHASVPKGPRPRAPKDYSFGLMLRLLRTRAGLTRKQLADRTGFPMRTLESWEQRRTEPVMFVAPSVARGLGVTIDELLADPPKNMLNPGRGRPPKQPPPAPKRRKE